MGLRTKLSMLFRGVVVGSLAMLAAVLYLGLSASDRGVGPVERLPAGVVQVSADFSSVDAPVRLTDGATLDVEPLPEDSR